MASEDADEIRGKAPGSIVAVLDAVACARNKKRFELVIDILQAWHDQQMREVIAVTRVTMGREERRQ